MTWGFLGKGGDFTYKFNPGLYGEKEEEDRGNLGEKKSHVIYGRLIIVWCFDFIFQNRLEYSFNILSK